MFLAFASGMNRGKASRGVKHEWSPMVGTSSRTRDVYAAGECLHVDRRPSDPVVADASPSIPLVEPIPTSPRPIRSSLRAPFRHHAPGFEC